MERLERQSLSVETASFDLFHSMRPRDGNSSARRVTASREPSISSSSWIHEPCVRVTRSSLKTYTPGPKLLSSCLLHPARNFLINLSIIFGKLAPLDNRRCFPVFD